MTDRFNEIRVASIGLNDTEELRDVQVVIGRLAVFSRVLEVCPDVRYVDAAFPRRITLTVDQVRALVAWSSKVRGGPGLPEYDQAYSIHTALYWLLNGWLS